MKATISPKKNREEMSVKKKNHMPDIVKIKMEIGKKKKENASKICKTST